MPTFLMPKPKNVAKLLSMLFAREVEATPGQPFDSGSAIVAGTYQDDEGNIQALCVLDFPLAAYTGAALTMIPSGTAEESIRAGELSESIDDNVMEVLNICVGFFSNESTPPIRLSQVHRGTELPAEFSTLLAGDIPRLDLTIEIDNYGEGTMTLLAA